MRKPLGLLWSLQGAVALLGTLVYASNHVFSTGPSAHCHVTDGAFTDCLPGGGIEEWSDISFLAGVGTSAGAKVYTDQASVPPRLLLMYDLTGHSETRRKPDLLSAKLLPAAGS